MIGNEEEEVSGRKYSSNKGLGSLPWEWERADL